MRLRDLPKEETLEIVGVPGFLLGGHHVSILLTKTPAPSVRRPMPGVRRLAKKPVAAIHKAREAPRGKRLVGFGRCAGDGGTRLLERTLLGRRSQEIFVELVHGRAVAGFLCEEFVNFDA